MIETLKKILWEYLNDKSVKIEPNSVIVSDLGIDSYEFTDIICSLEEEYDIDIEEKDFKKFRTIQDILTYLENKVKLTAQKIGVVRL